MRGSSCPGSNRCSGNLCRHFGSPPTKTKTATTASGDLDGLLDCPHVPALGPPKKKINKKQATPARQPDVGMALNERTRANRRFWSLVPFAKVPFWYHFF